MFSYSSMSSAFLQEKDSILNADVVRYRKKKGVCVMSLISGCQEGKGTPRLTEVKCPRCGETVEVFVKMGGAIGQTGTLVADEECTCGFILPAGSFETDYEEA